MARPPIIRGVIFQYGIELRLHAPRSAMVLAKALLTVEQTESAAKALRDPNDPNPPYYGGRDGYVCGTCWYLADRTLVHQGPTETS